MIAHALTIVKNELERHLRHYGGTGPFAELGNVSDAASTTASATSREKLLLSLVNVQEERTLKNVNAYVRDEATLRVRYENPPAFLNLAVLVAATHADYTNALSMLSRCLTFFQYQNVFTHDQVDPASLRGGPTNPLDRLVEFKLVFNLWSPTLEEVNDMWGMLGGKQFPFALYTVRMLELKFEAAPREAGLITEVVENFFLKAPVS